MSSSRGRSFRSIHSLFLLGVSFAVHSAVLPAGLFGQTVPPALESPAVRPPQTGPNGEKYIGMPKFHEPAPYDINEHTGYQQIFDGSTFSGWDADPTIWRVENGVMIGETLEGKPKGNNYIVYKGDKPRDFDLKLQMKIEKGGGGGIQYRSVTGVPWTRPQPNGQPPYDLKFMLTGPQADFWFPVTARTSEYTGQWYSENTMQGILAYRGQVTQALPGQTNRLVANIGDRQALGGYVKVNEWNDYEIIARGGVMMHIMNGQLMAVFIDDNKDSVNNQAGLIGFEIESQPCKISVRNIWLRKFD
ncbi:3-keto-disaccharide hydrolase [Paludibaculum fermentans]|uniref:3-keto-disaccharide hydrolase n=1 Tax=Paludibaculum fermentans TaxID=1473598 RepID=UPI003EBE4A15